MSKIDALLQIMARLRSPEGGCPWDLEQSFETIAPYTLEEAYEVDHAIALGDMPGLCDELGDLLLQVVFHAQMADEAGLFDFDQVVDAICDKLIRRHPHVFGDAANGGAKSEFRSAEDQTRFWEEEKARERAGRARAEGRADAPTPDPFEGIPLALPALARAAKLRKRASRALGIETTRSAESRAGLSKELEHSVSRLRSQLEGASEAEPEAREPARDALASLLCVCVDAARELGIDPEESLRTLNHAYEKQVRARIEEERE